MHRKLYNEYSEENLNKIQNIEKGILKEFHEICIKNNLDYFLCGGSAIGVIRHGGFIPWDDDIDVGMSREDYDKFLEIAERDHSDRYKIVNAETNKHFPLMNTRWGLNGTKYVTRDLANIKGEFGIFLDIFCFDNIPDNDRLMKKQATKAWLLGKLMVLSGVPKPVLYIKGKKKYIFDLVFFLGHYTLKIFRLKPEFFYNKTKKYMFQYKDVKTKRMAYMFDPKRYTSIVNKSDIYPTKENNFSELRVKVPNRTEEYLKSRYGDYMKMPPVDQRHNHPPYILDFGDK